MQQIKFDNNWEVGIAADTFASGDKSVRNATKMLSATVIPESTPIFTQHLSPHYKTNSLKLKILTLVYTYKQVFM
jgi:hypothetical protein